MYKGVGNLQTRGIRIRMVLNQVNVRFKDLIFVIFHLERRKAINNFMHNWSASSTQLSWPSKFFLKLSKIWKFPKIEILYYIIVKISDRCLSTSIKKINYVSYFKTSKSRPPSWTWLHGLLLSHFFTKSFSSNFLHTSILAFWTSWSSDDFWIILIAIYTHIYPQNGQLRVSNMEGLSSTWVVHAYWPFLMVYSRGRVHGGSISL